ncbi:MAG: DNA-protecting protein DprA [Chloroflexi bacterium]|nr:DNA-protecting protein DprA [Chloroflexota bacterium]
MDERAYWIVLNTAAGIGPIRFQRLLAVCGSAQAAWEAPDIELAGAGLERRTIDSLRTLRQRTTPEAILDKLTQLHVTPLTLLDDEYPLNLRQVADPPPVLFTRGRLVPSDTSAVALVGTRRATGYGNAVAYHLTRDLASAGVTLVSGLAKGIDTAVHDAAIRCGGRTIAVLGNGLDQVYPAENAPLARKILDCHAGALVSEFAPGIPPDAVNFPRRNRIISGLSLVTVILEAGERSGALITADFALEQGRDVLAVPGSIFSPTCAGTHQLLKQGATPVTTANDILDVLELSALRGTPADTAVACDMPALAQDETTVLHALSPEPRHIDALARDLTMRPGEVSATLAVLELKGLARQVGSMLYTRA